jgi:carbonic anhydrase/acetyltransferase-like protein (isoleucine patch superfamily)
MRSVILDRAVVEPWAMVAAGAVVTPGKTVPSGQIWAGIPARYWRDMSAAEIAEAAWIAEHYRELGGTYLEALAGPEDPS